MDFAKKQLEKYGWKTGKGLGKQENGITEAIKPKLKRGVAGIGHDAASEFTEHWWKTLYDKAAQNVEIQEENGAPKRFKAKEEFEITNSTWKLSRKKKSDQSKNPEYFENFVKKAVLTSGGTKLEDMSSESEDDEVLKVKKDVSTLTDEELFAACGGRTAHKGARHGLKATGKLARIQQQEQNLLTNSKFDGYSTKTTKQKKKNLQIEELTLSSDTEKKNKKEKKKYCNKLIKNDIEDFNSESDKLNKPQESIDTKIKNKFQNCDDKELISDCYKMEDTANSSSFDNDIETEVKLVSKKQKKAKTSDIDTHFEIGDNEIRDKSVCKKKKKSIFYDHNDIDNNSLNADELNNEIETMVVKSKKKKRRSF